MQKKRGAEEAGVEDELEERTKRKMQKDPGSSSDMQPPSHPDPNEVGMQAPAGEDDTLKTHSEDVEMSSARGSKRSAEESGCRGGAQQVQELAFGTAAHRLTYNL